MNQIKITLLIILTVPCCMVSPCRGDHLDRARGAAENELSNVYINVSLPSAVMDETGSYIEPMTTVLKTLGKPSNIHVRNECESDYLWIINEVRLEVGSGCVFQKVLGKDVLRAHGAYAVEVWGTQSSGEIGRTGRGLALGDSWSKMKRLYGFICNCGRYTSGTGTQVTHGFKYTRYAQYQWGDKAELDIDVDAQGRVVHMLLTGDLE